jgi:aryl-alcohol dehydrogenase-like predicted oxidoreductase
MASRLLFAMKERVDVCGCNLPTCSNLAQAEVIPTCRELGIGMVAYAPLGRGFLTGRISSVDDLAPGDRRREMPRFQGEALRKARSLYMCLMACTLQ